MLYIVSMTNQNVNDVVKLILNWTEPFKKEDASNKEIKKSVHDISEAYRLTVKKKDANYCRFVEIYGARKPNMKTELYKQALKMVEYLNHL